MGDYPEDKYDENDESDIRIMNDQQVLLSQYEDDGDKSIISSWLKDIKTDVDIAVRDEDTGNRDNIMRNKEFAKHFLRLCKLLPLWSGISCKVFGSIAVTSSSANVESYFKDVKHTLKEILPAKADVFLQNHMDGIDKSIITASQKYAKYVDVNVVTKATKSSSDSNVTKATKSSAGLIDEANPNDQNDDFAPYTYDYDSDFDARALFAEPDLSSESNAEHLKPSEAEPTSQCIACNDGNFPTGLHTCIKCKKMYTYFPGALFQ